MLSQELDIRRLAATLKRMAAQRVEFVELKAPSPFSLPLMVERFREKLSNEKLADRLERIVRDAERMADRSSKFTRLFRFANAARLATYLIALWKLFKHPQTPRAAKLVAIAVLAYAVSPIDLIPDFIPVLGQLDELILLPLGVALAVKLTPPAAVGGAAARGRGLGARSCRSCGGARLLIVLLWAVLFGLFVWWLVRLFAAA